jgi:putative aminopeptidase FrvX
MSFIDEKEIVSYIKELVSIPSPSGYTAQAIEHVAAFMERKHVPYQITNKGALLATLKGKDDSRHRLLTAHVDTLGAMVKEIKPNGRLKLTMVGGFRWNSVEGEYCKIHTADGQS